MLTAFLWALMFAAPAGFLALFRGGEWKYRIGCALTTGVVSFIVLFVIGIFVFLGVRPMMSFAGLWPLILVYGLITAVIAWIVDGVANYDNSDTTISASPIVVTIFAVVFAIVSIIGHNTDVTSVQDTYKISHLVKVDEHPDTAIVGTNTDHMVIVSPDIATTKANQDLSTGSGGSLNTYFNLGDPTLQYVGGNNPGMYYVFQLEFDGSGNRSRVNGIVPGYIMVSAENPNLPPIRHIGIDPITHVDYRMVVSIAGGLGSTPDAWAYNHGYSGYQLNDPTLEIGDNGHPYLTEALVQNRQGWNFDAPVGLLVIDANNGNIHRYGLGNIPDWVDRVYSSDMASTIASWWGSYAHAPFNRVGGTNANRLQVSGDPVLVYANNGHPSWRMLMTSYNADTSVNKIVLMDARTGTMQVYLPDKAMGIESTAIAAFENTPNSINGVSVKSSHYRITDLSLHMIYGHLTWVGVYEPEGGNPSFVGIGFLDAYDAQASFVGAGSSKSEALQNYLQQLAQESASNGQANSGGLVKTITGHIYKFWTNVESGQSYAYIVLREDPKHVYRLELQSQQAATIGLVQTGDPVTITVFNVGNPAMTNVRSFTDNSSRILVPQGAGS